ncbi:site-2 protease family protein [Bacillus sp. SB49]|uniref:site-2 protease family protein n=1 Tax=Bacillus sp. SB49 TaxID=1071080 RepID=UPI000478A473|nr:site-2 protease family protein [Bacillus sp. SB49]
MITAVFLLVLLVAPLSLFIHELGHVFFGLAFRSECSTLQLGRGYRIIDVRSRKFRLVICLFFFQGAFSINEREPSFTRQEQGWISFGGPLFNIGAAGLVWPLLGIHIFWSLLFWFNLYLAVANMIPFTVNGRKSDGCHVWSSFRRHGG